MSDIDLTGDITLAVDGAAERRSALVMGYVDDEGYASLSHRGSVQVHSKDQLAFWARKPQGAFIDAIAARPVVTFLYYSRDTPGAIYLSIRGRARVAPDVNEEVYDAMIDGEKGQDADRAGVAVIVDVDSVRGAGPEGAPISQQRAG